jgi:hypothetical protein
MMRNRADAARSGPHMRYVNRKFTGSIGLIVVITSFLGRK